MSDHAHDPQVDHTLYEIMPMIRVGLITPMVKDVIGSTLLNFQSLAITILIMPSIKGLGIYPIFITIVTRKN